MASKQKAPSNEIVEYSGAVSLVGLEYDIIAATGNRVTVAQMQALQVLIDGTTPPSAIERRPDGVRYLEHGWVKRLMQQALPGLWDFEVLEQWINDDQSASVKGRFTLHIPGHPISTVTEIASFEAYPASQQEEVAWIDDPNDPSKQISKKTGKKFYPVDPFTGKVKATMNTGDRIASASSRCFVRCVATMFGLGLEIKKLYKMEGPSVEKCWNDLSRLNKNKGGLMTAEEMGAVLKKEGIGRENLVARFADAWYLITLELQNRSYEQLPEGL